MLRPLDSASAIGATESPREALARFLRKRRETITPEQVGMSSRRGRRTPGLRREEVAFLADIGVKWYARLEAGDEIHPSESTLAGIAAALQLSSAEFEYMLDLAGLRHSLPSSTEVRTTLPEPILALLRTPFEVSPFQSAIRYLRRFDGMRWQMRSTVILVSSIRSSATRWSAASSTTILSSFWDRSAKRSSRAPWECSGSTIRHRGRVRSQMPFTSASRTFRFFNRPGIGGSSPTSCRMKTSWFETTPSWGGSQYMRSISACQCGRIFFCTCSFRAMKTRRRNSHDCRISRWSDTDRTIAAESGRIG